jgi:hypothetical protein
MSRKLCWDAACRKEGPDTPPWIALLTMARPGEGYSIIDNYWLAIAKYWQLSTVC